MRVGRGRKVVLFCLCVAFAASSARADETCMSPYMAKIVGQEDFVYVWTLGMEGVGDEQDKLVTIDVNPTSPQYGQGRACVVCRRAQRGTPFGFYRRPALSLGQRSGYQQDLHLRRREQPWRADLAQGH